MLNKLKFVLTILTVICFWTLPNAFAQTEPLTYWEIITELNSKDCNQKSKNKTEVNSFLTKEIQKRKVKSILNSEIENLLIESGANETLIKTIKTSFLPDGKNDAEYYFNSGNQYFQKKDFDRAIIEYTKAIQLNSGYALAHFNRGKAYKEKGDIAKAIMDYTEAINWHQDINTRDDYYEYVEEFYLKRAEIQSDPILAIADYSEVIRRNRKNIQAYLERGHNYLLNNDFDSARADFNQAVKLAPNNVNTYISRAEYYYRLEDWNRAVADWKKVLEIDPNNERAKGNLGSRLEDEEEKLINTLSPEDEPGKMSFLTLKEALELKNYVLPAEKRKQIIIKYIKQKKVDFTLTNKIEDELSL